MQTAGFPFIKTLDDYDFSFQPSVNKTEIEDYKTLRFLENNENILFVGSSGVEKTHLATAIGIEAIKHRNSVYFITCQDLINQLKKAEHENDPLAKEEAIKRIRKAYDMGYTFFDTAQRYLGVYPDGSTAYNEEVVGEALKDIREQVVIATKCGISIINGKRILDSRSETIKSTLEDSLKKLQTDYVDLYYLLSMDESTDVEEVARTMKELYEQGKIRAWGLSQCNEEALRKAHAIFPVSAVQLRYSMMARWEERMFAVCKELGVTFVTFSPMANGFLTGAYSGNEKYEPKSDFRSRMPQFTQEGYEANKKVLGYIKQLAIEKNATMTQISLVWMENKDLDIVPIPGSTKLERLEENCNSCKVSLTKAEVNGIDEMLAKIATGPVYGDQKK